MSTKECVTFYVLFIRPRNLCGVDNFFINNHNNLLTTTIISFFILESTREVSAKQGSNNLDLPGWDKNVRVERTSCRGAVSNLLGFELASPLFVYVSHVLFHGLPSSIRFFDFFARRPCGELLPSPVWVFV